MSPRSILAVVVLVVAALGSWYLARQSGDAPTARAETEPAYLGYYLEDARILGTSPDGSLLYVIQAEHAKQESEETIRFSTVAIEYTPVTDIPWSIRADTAVLSQGEPRVWLEGDVRARSAEGFSGDETEVRTPSLTFDPDRHIAETDQRVEILIGNRSLSGTGMVASLTDNRVELRANVSGRFVPQ